MKYGILKLEHNRIDPESSTYNVEMNMSQVIASSFGNILNRKFIIPDDDSSPIIAIFLLSDVDDCKVGALAYSHDELEAVEMAYELLY